MKFTKNLNIFLATIVFSSATADENQDPARGGLRGNRKFSEEERILNPWSSLGEDILCGNGKVGNGYCPDNACCSKWGYCGTSEDHCLDSAPGFFPRLQLGDGDDDKGPYCGKGQVGNGRCVDGSYCSKFGWCGNESQHYEQPAPNANLQLFREAAFMSQMSYFVFENHRDSKKRTPNCQDPDGNKLDYCAYKEYEIDAALVTKYRNKCFVSFRGTVSLQAKIVTNEEFTQFFGDAYQNIITENSMNEEQCTYREGYDLSYRRTKEFLKTSVRECQEKCGEFGKNGCEVVLTGHSKGGAVAQAASFDSDVTMKELFDDPFVVTFGAPAFATRKSECENSINEMKHFRIVTSDGNGECDPITEKSSKSFSFYADVKNGTTKRRHTIEDRNSQETFHMGNVVLLNKDNDRSYQIAQGFGDDTCEDVTFRNQKKLTARDFVRGFLESLFESSEGEEPLHNVKTYKGRLQTIMEGKKDGKELKVIDGFNKNHICKKNWQCADDMMCNNKRCQ